METSQLSLINFLKLLLECQVIFYELLCMLIQNSPIFNRLGRAEAGQTKPTLIFPVSQQHNLKSMEAVSVLGKMSSYPQ